MMMLAMLLLNACRKLRYEDTKVEVFVLDIATGEAFTKPYSVGLKEIWSDINGTYVTQIDRQQINSEGKVFFDFEAKKSGTYDYEVEFYYSTYDRSVSTSPDDESNSLVDRISLEKGIETKCTLKVAMGHPFQYDLKNKSLNHQNESMCGIWVHRVAEVRSCMEGREERLRGTALWEGWYEMSYFIVSNGDTTFYDNVGRVYNQPDEVTYSEIIHNPDSL